jgi:DNA mismatch repair ATPase MutS
MIFKTDKQTRKDLNIFDSNNNDDSIFNYYNSTELTSSKVLFEDLFLYPTNDIKVLNDRKEVINFIHQNKLKYSFDDREINFIQIYLKSDINKWSSNYISRWKRKLFSSFEQSNDIYLVRKGCDILRNQLINLKNYFNSIDLKKAPSFFHEFSVSIEIFFNDEDLNISKINTFEELDKHFRFTYTNKVKRILSYLNYFDIYSSLASKLNNENFSLPHYKLDIDNYIQIDNFSHPLIQDPVKNSFEIEENKNLCFFTGANMAGKSTTLKSIALIVYLAHIGIPIPATKMSCSIFNGIFTTINIDDDINKGFSHYYSEVVRIKNVANHIKEQKNCLIIFDELFRGTNVKDAFDGSLLVMNAFSKLRNSSFLISSHIIELADKLTLNNHITFKCMETQLNNKKNKYTYKLIDGISKDRLGLKILNDEKIEEIINSINES